MELSACGMIVRKTIRAKILPLTFRKEALLKLEYENFQKYLRGEKSVKLYSATRQQAERLLRRIKSPKPNKEYPLIIRRDVFRVDIQDTKLTKYWAKIPTHKGSVFVPIRPHEELEGLETREAKLLRRNGEWWLFITVQKDVEDPKPNPNKIIAIDIGDKNIATKVELNNGKIEKPKFYGREVRGIRRHFDWLRRRLGKKKLLRVIKRIGNKEKRKVNDILHKISREIVNRAKETGATIVVGYPKGIRKRNGGKTLNRIVNRIPYYKLIKFIEYKAQWEGVPFIKINEQYTSVVCHRCGSKGKRPTQGLFKCKNCGLEYNADLNGAINIAKLSLGYMLRDGAGLTQPLTGHETIALACSQRGAMVESSESPYLSGESVKVGLIE